MPTFLSRLGSLRDLGRFFERPKRVKSRLSIDQLRDPVDFKLREDALSGGERAPSDSDSWGGVPQDYKLKIDVDEL